MKRSTKNILGGIAIGSLITLTVYPSSFDVIKDKLNMKVVNQEEMDEEVYIPSSYIGQVRGALNLEQDKIITKSDLANLTTLRLTIYDNSSLSWLNNTNVSTLFVELYSDNINVLSDIEELPELKEFSFVDCANCMEHGYDDVLTKDVAKFLYNKENITSLNLQSVYIDEDVLHSMKGLKYLRISSYFNPEYYNYDYNQFVNLDELYIPDYSVFNYSIYFTKEEYDNLVSHGVNVHLLDEETLSTYLVINQWLDDIIKDNHINELSTDEEKINAIVKYVLKNFEYDDEVLDNIVNNNGDTSKNGGFYVNGFLYGAMSKETQICGNYAAFVQALMKRAGVSSTMLFSTNHAWNKINLNGTEYYIDTTWLDQQVVTVERSDGVLTTLSASDYLESLDDEYPEQLEWYLVNEQDMAKYDTSTSHDAKNIPNYDVSERSFDPQPFVIETNETNKTVTKEESVGKKTISLAVLIGIALAIGNAVEIKKIKRTRREYEKQLKKQNKKDINIIDL